MQLRHLKTISPAGDKMNKVTAVAWSPNNRRLAVVTVDRVVSLYDENGTKRDKFATKPGSKDMKNYLVKGLCFSPDSTKLAIAQSDNIVFVYKLGIEWGDKKSICNKFPQSTSLTALCWPRNHPGKICFGLASGKVKIGQTKTNKPATLYNSGSHVVAMCASPDGYGLASGHVDGSIFTFFFEDAQSGGGPAHRKLCQHSSPPYALSWGESLVAAGLDSRITFYSGQDGSTQRTFDYRDDVSVKGFTCAAFNPSGETVVVGNFDKFFSFNFNQKTLDWDENPAKVIPNMYTVSALGWKPDGSRLSVGSLCGAVDLFDACVRRANYRGQFEFTYVSLSQVIVRRLVGPNAGHRIVLKSQFGCEINKINIFHDRYLIGKTTKTILVGDLDSCRLSEVQWDTSEGVKERYIFENASCAMVYCAGELTLIEYGRNEILGSCRTEHMRSAVISVRINERPPARDSWGRGAGGKFDDGPSGGAGPGNRDEWNNKKVAYLLDVLTARVLDLATGVGIAEISHDSKIDWLELNGRGNLLLFRDKRRQLHLYNIVKQERTTLLSYCNYVQWVPDSDVVVAQNRNNLCVWYNINAPDKVSTHKIKGEIEEIERSGGRTEVIVDEGINTASYQLEEALIGFGTAVEDRDFKAAIRTLEEQDLNPQTEAMWDELAGLALDDEDLATAERCFAALGNIAKSRYLRRIKKNAIGISKKTGQDGMQHWAVRSMLAQLRGDYTRAERIFVKQGQVEEAIEMYQTLHRWDDAIKVAEQASHPEVEQMKTDYFAYLRDSGQEERAAELKAAEGDYVTAINLYLKGGYPARAAQIVKQHDVRSGGQQLLERIANDMTRAGMHERAGEFYEMLDQLDRALELYLEGRAYRPAVELARRSFPDRVVRLEARWGDWLVEQKRVDQAINHYIEAGEHEKAIRAALDSAQWAKAAQLVEDTLNGDVAKPYYMRIASHYRDKRRYDLAERYFVKASKPNEAVDMYTRANKWEAAHRVAVRFMSENEASMLYINQAQEHERKGMFGDAERLYLTVNEPDLAINMYKKARKFDQMLRLVSQYRKELLKDTNLHLAQQLEMEGALREAETYYCEAGEWQSAVNMWRANDSWDEAIRIAKYHGGVQASQRVAYAWALSIGGAEGSKLLTRLGLIEQAVDYAVESGNFSHAFELAQNSLKSKLPEVHLKHALFLEDEEKFDEAKDEFIKAGKPREAIDMYIHQQDWNSATLVANNYEPAAIPDVYIAQARAAQGTGDLNRAESLFIQAKKPQLALKMFQDAARWQDAIRVAKRHLPHKLAEVNEAYSRFSQSGGALSPQQNSMQTQQRNSGGRPGRRHGNDGSKDGTSDGSSGVGGSGQSQSDVLAAARTWEETGHWDRAVEAYLDVSLENTGGNTHALAEIWLKAVKVSSQHQDQRRCADVSRIVADRLADGRMKRFESAGNLYRDIEMFRESVQAYIDAKAWGKARQVCDQDAPNLRNMVEQAYQSHMSNAGDASGLVSAGKVSQGLDIFAQKGQWDELFDVCAKSAPEQGPRYATIYATQLIEDGNRVDQAIQVLGRFGADPSEERLTLYKKIIKQFLGRSDKELRDAKSTQSPAVLAESLRSMLYKLVADMKAGASRGGAGGRGGRSRDFGGAGKYDEGQKSGTSGHLPWFEKALMTTHYVVMRDRFKEWNMTDAATQTAVSLLRFCDVIPPDKAFYLAGMACKDDSRWESMAFVLLNHYLDISEAIEEGDPSTIDNSDFVGTDIPAPYDYALPKSQYLDEDRREEVRDWVLQISMNQEIDQTLRVRSCPSCNKEHYEASTICPHCKHQYDSCIGSGYPVVKMSMDGGIATCRECSSNFDKKLWNASLRCNDSKCMWCDAKAQPVY